MTDNPWMEVVEWYQMKLAEKINNELYSRADGFGCSRRRKKINQPKIYLIIHMQIGDCLSQEKYPNGMCVLNKLLWVD